MSRYEPLVQVLVGHDYFQADPCRVVELEPTRATRALAERAGLLLRRSPGSLAILHDAHRADALALWAEDLGPDFRLDFELVARDPLFANYTHSSLPRGGGVLAFDTLDTDPQPDGTFRLSKEERVSEKDIAELDSDRVAAVLASRDRRVLPTAILSIHLADEAGNLLDPGPGESGRVYRLDFRARETYWRYLLLGEHDLEGASITDSDMITHFEFGGEATLPGDRTALSFRSGTPIPLRERSDRRFQLRTEGGQAPGNGRVLVSRLPVASAKGLQRETIDGESVFVSDIFIYV